MEVIYFLFFLNSFLISVYQNNLKIKNNNLKKNKSNFAKVHCHHKNKRGLSHRLDRWPALCRGSA
jgi:hypothetical protein